MTLCTEANVEAAIQRTIPDGEADDLIDLVSGYLEGYLGREFEEVELTATLTGKGASYLILPHWPLSAVGSVTENDTTLVIDDDYTVYLPTGSLYRRSTGYLSFWSTTTDGIVVEYTPRIPGDLRAVAARIVGRIWVAGQSAKAIIDSIPELYGLTQMSVGAWSATVDKDQLDPATLFDLGEIDRMILDGYADRLP